MYNDNTKNKKNTDVVKWETNLLLPALSQEINVQNTTKAFIRDYEGLFIGFGKRQNCISIQRAKSLYR